VRHKCDFSNRGYLKRSRAEQAGQARLAPAPATFSKMLGSIADIPWRPGMSHLRRGLANWGYRWIDRWYAYAGRVEGTYEAWRHGPVSIPGYEEYR